MTQINMMNADDYKHSEITESGFALNNGKKPAFTRKVFSNKKNLIFNHTLSVISVLFVAAEW